MKQQSEVEDYGSVGFVGVGFENLLARRYSSRDCSVGIFLLAQGEFASWFKSSSLQIPDESSPFRNSGEPEDNLCPDVSMK